MEADSGTPGGGTTGGACQPALSPDSAHQFASAGCNLRASGVGGGFLDGLFDCFTAFASALLNPADYFFELALGKLEIVIRELGPFLFQLALGNVPVAFDFECVHGLSFLVLFVVIVTAKVFRRFECQLTVLRHDFPTGSGPYVNFQHRVIVWASRFRSPPQNQHHYYNHRQQSSAAPEVAPIVASVQGSLRRNGPRLAKQYPVSAFRPAESACEIDDKAYQQNQAKPTAADDGATKVESAAAE
jgi:hypothetical protein